MTKDYIRKYFERRHYIVKESTTGSVIVKAPARVPKRFESLNGAFKYYFR